MHSDVENVKPLGPTPGLRNGQRPNRRHEVRQGVDRAPGPRQRQERQAAVEAEDVHQGVPRVHRPTGVFCPIVLAELEQLARQEQHTYSSRCALCEAQGPCPSVDASETPEEADTLLQLRKLLSLRRILCPGLQHTEAGVDRDLSFRVPIHERLDVELRCLRHRSKYGIFQQLLPFGRHLAGGVVPVDLRKGGAQRGPIRMLLATEKWWDPDVWRYLGAPDERRRRRGGQGSGGADGDEPP
mmetsp:Transcript_149105/g.478920  ORF Transcript_149105/g.478920 Transcript_149105/m.478920 type:complete len:241 (+) Transcript_149105:1580-2302(+)